MTTHVPTMATRRPFRLSSLCYALLPLLSLAVSSAHAAETTEDAPSATLDTIVVKANPLYRLDTSYDNDLYSANVATVGTKIPDYLENIPQSISVITKAKIEDTNVNTLDQIAKRTPGLRVLQNDDGRSSIFSRGYEYDQYSIDGLSAPMASINGTLPNLAPFERVEVLRGPSGLFNAASELGGVVNLVRKRGEAGGEQTLKASISDPKGYEVMADVQGSLSEDDSLVGRSVIQYDRQANPIVDDIDGEDNDNSSAYFSIDKRLNDTTAIGAGYLYQERNITPNNGLPTAADGSLLSLPNDDFYGARWNDFSSKSNDVFADLQHQLPSKGIVSAGVRYSDRKSDYNYAFAGSALSNGTTNVAGTSGDIDENSISADISLSQPFVTGKTQSEYVIGMDYKRFNVDSARASSKALAKSLTASQINDLGYIDILQEARNGTDGYRLTHTENTLRELGLYAKVNYKLLERLSLIAGGRISNYEVDSENKATGTTASISDDHHTTGYGALVYELTPSINAYGSYTQAFAPQYVADVNGDLLKPREGEQFEIGLKGNWQDTLSARLSAYRMTDENAAATTTSGDQVALGEREMQGFEVEFNGEITPDWQLSAGYTYLDSDIKQASTTSDDGIFLLMPKHSANLWTTYKVNNVLAQPLTVGLGIDAVGSFSSSNGIEADSYYTWDAMASYPFSEQLTGQINVYNLLDDDHYVRVGAVNTFNIPGDGREFKASLTYKF